MQGGVGAGVRRVSAAFLVRDQQFPVRRELLVRRVGEGLLCRTELSLRPAEFGQGEVDGVPHGAGRIEVESLGEVAGAAREADSDLPGVRPLRSGEQPQQGGLAGTVLADDGGPLAWTDGEGDVIEDGSGALGLGDVLDRQLGHGGGGDGGQGGAGAVAHMAFPWACEGSTGSRNGGMGRARTQTKKR
ncbi:hypothetical protein GCM10010309_72320 [Streptomyces violaceochromogenes]|nr:hypothetical protein GCM10010309_72320 [Streptomyces violaceochromogenes]